MSNKVCIDGNTAVAGMAYLFSEVAAIYPITPSSTMGELMDEWSSAKLPNLLGNPVRVVTMQSEGGAAGVVHGSLVAGALTSTFTSSQGLLLMIPDMHRIAGELLPCVFHVATRSLAAQSLSIFCDHSDVMACRNTGFAMLSAANVQEALDLALVAHLATLKTSVPFIHFFDGMRTSHEIQKIEAIARAQVEQLFDLELLQRFRKRALRPEAPQARVGAQNADVYFQGREAANSYYAAVPAVVQHYFDALAQLCGRQYHLCEYVGHPQAEEVLVVLGSAIDTVEATIAHLNRNGYRVGLVKLRLFRPLPAAQLAQAFPASCRRVAVLDRTKEPGSVGEPLYLDVLSALNRHGRGDIAVIGGRYGLSSREFSPQHVQAVIEHLRTGGRSDFTVGINDDVTHLSLPLAAPLNITPPDVRSCIFWGLGSDGTVGANKNTIKIIGDNTPLNAQGYFFYDSKKAFGLTVSHLRFGNSKLLQPYLIEHADLVAVHHPSYLGRYDMFSCLKNDGIVLINSPFDTTTLLSKMTTLDLQVLRDRNIKLYNINAIAISREVGLGNRINTVMQAAFFHIAQVLPAHTAIELIKKAAQESYASKGEHLVKMNWRAIDASVAALQHIEIPLDFIGVDEHPQLASFEDDFARNIVAPFNRFQGAAVPVSQVSADGILPLGTAALEKRAMTAFTPRWLSENCIQCNQCVMACPHSVIRAKQIDPDELAQRPPGFLTIRSNTVNGRDLDYRIQIYIDDCTGCAVCVDVCPAKKKALEMVPIEEEIASGERQHYNFFDRLPENILDGTKIATPKGIGFVKPLFEFHSACAGCGETPYIKLATQLFGKRMVIANATGCSSIYSGTYPTVPYTKDVDGRGPAWGNSLFEDNAEYALGMRLAIDNNRLLLRQKLELGRQQLPEFRQALAEALEDFDDISDETYQRKQQLQLRLQAAQRSLPHHTLIDELLELLDYLVEKSVWAIGGDGWAYDIGYGGLDHMLSRNLNINVLVLDTESYSNTGGQLSKATPLAAVGRFASKGNRMGKKELGLTAMGYGHVYVASVAMGANRTQVIRAFMEAEAHPGPSLIMAYSPCIAHGIDMSKTQTEQKLAVSTGYYFLYRFNPALEKGKRLIWDARPPSYDIRAFLDNEHRYQLLSQVAPESREQLYHYAAEDARRRAELLQRLGEVS